MRKNIFKVILVGLVAMASFTGCTGVPKDALKLNSSTLELRQLQTREYQTNNDTKILSASIGILQDLGFTINESEKRLGVITASKTRDATEAGQVAGAIAVALLGGGAIEIDKIQKIRAAIVVNKSQVKKNSYSVRVSFQRIVTGTRGSITKVQTIIEPDIYQKFFNKLSQSIFLQGHNI